MSTATKTASTPPRQPQRTPPGVESIGAVSYSVRPSRATFLVRRLIVMVAILGSVAIAAAGVMALRSEPGTAADGDITADLIPLDNQTVQPAVGPIQDLDPIDPAESVEPDQIVIGEEDLSDSVAVAVPPRASQFVAQAPDRVLDTRDGAALSVGDAASISLQGDQNAVALSVSIVGAASQGVVTIDGRAGSVEAAVTGGPGVSTTNLVFVPVLGHELTVRSSTGAHLVIDVVGSFGAPDDSGAGRFVATEPTEVTRLVTETDGREAIVPFDGVIPVGQADAVLVSITADVGADGGVVRLGADGQFNQMLMWGPVTNDNRTRRGLVLLQPGTDLSASLRYDGGSVLSAEVVGYFTGASSINASSINDGQNLVATGLYVPSGPRTLFSGQLNPVDPIVVGGISPQAETALVTANALGGSADESFGLPGSRLIPVGEGTVALTSTGTNTVEITLLGVFLGSS